MGANTVTIVDYGVGNLLSVARAVEEVGARPILSGDPGVIADADRLILPGDGAFGYGMAELRRRGLVDPLRACAAAGRPFLGVCLGMQIMFDESEEFGRHDGLGLIPGRVAAMPARDPDGRKRRIPHMGWGALTDGGAGNWAGSCLDGLTPGVSAVYFVHSFMALPEHCADQLAGCDYDGLPVCAVVRRNNLTGCQFHPEKSGPVGLKILRAALFQTPDRG